MNYLSGATDVMTERYGAWVQAAPRDPELYQQRLSTGYKVGGLAVCPGYLTELALREEEGSEARQVREAEAEKASLQLGGIETELARQYCGAVLAMQITREDLPPEDQHNYAAGVLLVTLLVSPDAFDRY